MNSSAHRFLAPWCALALLTCIASGCAKAPAVVTQPYEPARVDCEQQRTPDAPPWPTLWWLDGPGYTITVLGILEQERALRELEQDCIARLKANGVIR